MARYVTRVQTPLSADEAFDYVADLTNFAEWDPGVRRSVQVAGAGSELGAAYDVTVAAVPRDLTLRYEVVEHDAPRSCLVVARSGVFTSTDRITVVPDGDGSIVTYDAELTLNGPLGLFDPLLRLAFGRIGDRAAAGLRRALDGVAVPT
ncbi:MAG: SRPBCC family protein [Acidimicrobiales bacterium]|nr:SRPBCC family protein [Acidimicrobiales bacterium]